MSGGEGRGEVGVFALLVFRARDLSGAGDRRQFRVMQCAIERSDAGAIVRSSHWVAPRDWATRPGNPTYPT